MASGGMSVRVSYDKKGFITGLVNRVKNLLGKGTSDEAQREITSRYGDYIYQYVPYKKGTLANSATVVKHEKGGYAVQYSAMSKKGYNYADYQYRPEKYGEDDSYWDRTTPGTYSHWNTHLTRSEKEAFNDEVKKIVKENMNRG